MGPLGRPIELTLAGRRLPQVGRTTAIETASASIAQMPITYG